MRSYNFIKILNDVPNFFTHLLHPLIEKTIRQTDLLKFEFEPLTDSHVEKS
jgi:hypothetical protein